ncbi:MAG: response regulator, partial [Spirochaetaceae bacterium]|nr:response regulator [Spirochaetaceae bacterium]
VMICKEDTGLINSFEDIGNQSVGVLKDYITEFYVNRDYPEINLVLYDNTANGLKAVSKGSLDIFITDIPSFEYYSQKSSLSNLRISGFTSYSMDLSIGVENGAEDLLSILNKALGHISANEKGAIYSDWVNQAKPLIDYSLIWKIALIGFVLFVIIFLWNRRLAREIILRKEAEKSAVYATQAKSDFLANMSHEIRTPMNSILGFAELLDNIIVDREQRSYLQSIRSSGTALMDIINDILDLSKIEAGKFTVKPVPTNIRKICDDMGELFRDRFLHKKITFEIVWDKAFPHNIMIDGPRVRQILVNLIGNAVKFTSEGQIQLIVSLLQSSSDLNTIDFTMSVKDTGVGIPEDQLLLIFEKFKQQDGQDIAEYGGTGLGLAICEQISKLLGGTISVKSRVGEGSVFTVDFHNIPLFDEVDREAGDRKNLIVFEAADILIADDIKDNRILLMENFRHTDLVFHEASNGREALDILGSRKIDLVFLDLRMPVLNGYETIELIKKEKNISQIPVVAFTASIMSRDLEKIGQFGFDAYLRKPVNHEQLLTVLIRFLPYREQPFTEIDSSMDLLEIHDAESLFSLLESDFYPEWEDIRDKGDFSLIVKFAGSLKKEAERHKAYSIIQYADRLIDYADSYDIIEVEKLMNQFPEIIERIRESLIEE